MQGYDDLYIEEGFLVSILVYCMYFCSFLHNILLYVFLSCYC